MSRFCVLATMPTISIGGDGRSAGPIETRRPSASAPGRNFDTNAWLTIATSGALRRSVFANARPATSGTPRFAKCVALAAVICDIGIVSPSAAIESRRNAVEKAPCGGNCEATDAARTPGVCSRRSRTCWKNSLIGGAAILLRRHGDAHRQHLLGIEARLDILKSAEAADEQARADEQHHRERDFSDDQRVAKTKRHAAGSGAAAVALQRILRTGARGLEHRQHRDQRRPSQSRTPPPSPRRGS